MTLTRAMIPTTSDVDSLMSACVAATTKHAKAVRRRPEMFARLVDVASQAVDDIAYDNDRYFGDDIGAYRATAGELSELRRAYSRATSASRTATYDMDGAKEILDSRRVLEAAILALLMAAIPHLNLGIIGRWVAGRVAQAIAEWLAKLLTEISPESEAGVQRLVEYRWSP